MGLIIGVALPMGFRSSVGIVAWLVVAGISVLFTLALTWIAAIAGLSAKPVDGVSAFPYPFLFLPFVSSAFLPTRFMPTVVRAFANNQPINTVADALRSLLAGHPADHALWMALAWCAGICAVA